LLCASGSEEVALVVQEGWEERQEEAENAPVVGDFRHAPTTHGLHERATLRTPRFNARDGVCGG